MTITSYGQPAETVNAGCTEAWLCFGKNDLGSDPLSGLDSTVFQTEFDYLFLQSGVAVHCGDCGSSNSDITEPCSPLSTTSLEEMPPTQSQSQPAWPWSESSDQSRPPKRRKQGKITEFFKIKSKSSFVGMQKAKPLSDYKDNSGLTLLVESTDDYLPSPPPLCEPPDLFETPPPSREEELTTSTDSCEDQAPGTDSCEDQVPGTDSSEDQTHCTYPWSGSCEDSSTATSLFKEEEDEDEGTADVTSLFGRSSASSSSSSSIKEEERTIRFPVKNGWNGHYVSDVICRWMGCEAKFGTSTALLEHLQKIHVDGQTLEEYFYCRWKGCKVFDRKSCSRSWLGRHVLSHGGNKRFACIVEGCGQRFNSQVLLTRHVNGHFVDKDIKKDSKTGCEVNSKLIRRNGKKLRYRREPFSARTQDYIDTGVMEGIQYNLIKVTEKRTLGLFDQVSPDSLVLRSEIIAKRTDPKGISEVLVRWFPKNILEDEWMDPTKVERTRSVRITTLTPESKDCLYEYLWGHQNLSRTPRCRKQGHPHT